MDFHVISAAIGGLVNTFSIRGNNGKPNSAVQIALDDFA